MTLCMTCSTPTSYTCLSCKNAICNKTVECSVPAHEETSAWQMSISAVQCLPGFKKTEELDRKAQALILRLPTKSKSSSVQDRKKFSPKLADTRGNRKCLTLRQKIEVIQQFRQSRTSTRRLASQFECGKTQMINVLKNKEKNMSR